MADDMTNDEKTELLEDAGGEATVAADAAESSEDAEGPVQSEETTQAEPVVAEKGDDAQPEADDVPVTSEEPQTEPQAEPAVAEPEPQPAAEPESTAPAKADRKQQPSKADAKKGRQAAPAKKPAAKPAQATKKEPAKKEPAKKPANQRANAAKGRGRRSSGLPTPAWVCICVALLVSGILIGHFLIAGGQGGSTIALNGRTTLSSGELDAAIASYTHDGVTTEITSREVIVQNSTIEAAANDDGSYDVPSASSVVSYAQTQVVVADAEEQGLTVTDDEITDYITNTMGSDVSTIATSYSLDEDTVTELVRQSLLLQKLQETVCTTEVPDIPTSPTEPEEDAEDTPTADYATYIINLLGDEWDSETGTWATTDGTYYATLSGYEITNDSATYAAAEAAYNIAYEAYSTASTERQTQWSDYYNNIFANTTIQIGSLAMSSY